MASRSQQPTSRIAETGGTASPRRFASYGYRAACNTVNDRRNVAWTDRRRGQYASGLAGWRDAFEKDRNSIETDPGYALSAKVGFGGSGMVDPAVPLSVEDLILPPDSPCRGAGENGEDIGPRWETFLRP